MEFVEGKTLRELIEEKSVDADHVVKIVRQIAEAIAAAHRKKVIHRDIKPENIIVAENELVKVLDFGLAKISPNIETDEDLSLLDASVLETTPGILFGTTSYMSPEQLREQTLDERADLWSLGVIFYELLTGKRPFEGETRNDKLAAILKSEPEKISVKNLKNSRAVEKLIFKLLEKNRDKRFQTADEFLTELGKILKNPFQKSQLKIIIRKFPVL